MKKILSISGWLVMAAALTAGMTACSSEDNMADEPAPTTTGAPKTYTMTVTASKSADDAATRALSLDGKTLNATWTEGEKIRVMKRREMMGTVDFALLGTLSASSVTDGGLTATFTGSLDADKVSAAGGLAAGDKLLLGYPGDHLGPSTSAFVFNYTGQDGTLETIARDYDYCMTTTSKSKMVAVESVDDVKGAVTTTGTASFQNQQAIVRFTLTEGDGTTPVCPTSLDITAVGLVESVALPESGGTSATPTEQTLTLSPDGSTNVIYAALRGISGRDVTLRVTTSNGRIIHYTKSDVTFTNGQYYAINVKMSKNLAALTADYTAQDGDILTGTLGGNYKVMIADGATVTLRGVTINGTNNTSCMWAGITCLGDATIVLDEETTNTVRGFYEAYPGIQPAAGKTLTIEGTGTLNASSNGSAAGIGGAATISCGNIHIKSGNITATSSGYSSGIGSGHNAACGTITISGGNVTAYGGSSSAAIGCGNGGSCGDILIEGGTVSATATYSNGSTCIGKTVTGSTCPSVTFTRGITRMTLTNANKAGIGDFIDASDHIMADTHDIVEKKNNAVNWLYNWDSTFTGLFPNSSFSTGTWVIAP